MMKLLGGGESKYRNGHNGAANAVVTSGMLSPRSGLAFEAQKTGLGLMTVVASVSSSLASWPRSFWSAVEVLCYVNT